MGGCSAAPIVPGNEAQGAAAAPRGPGAASGSQAAAPAPTLEQRAEQVALGVVDVAEQGQLPLGLQGQGRGARVDAMFGTASTPPTTPPAQLQCVAAIPLAIRLRCCPSPVTPRLPHPPPWCALQPSTAAGAATTPPPGLRLAACAMTCSSRPAGTGRAARKLAPDIRTPAGTARIVGAARWHAKPQAQGTPAGNA
jgi:hypothetical protein